MYCSPQYQTTFKSIGLTVQEKFKIDFFKMAAVVAKLDF